MKPDRTTDSDERGIGLARALNLPIYFFELDSVLAFTKLSLTTSREQLMALCQEQLDQTGRDEVLIQAATGFYLVVQSTSGDAAQFVAERMNSALLTKLFGDAPVPKQFVTLFRPVTAAAPGQPSANEDSERSTVPSLSASAAAGAERARAVHPSHEPSDPYSELAMRGVLPGKSVELLFEPVHDLLRARSTTFFCMPAFCVGGDPVIRGYAAFEHASQRERPLIDRAMLAHSMKFARRLAQAGVFAVLGTPVSFETLSSTTGRELYRKALQAAGVPDFPSIVLCLKNLPIGITASRLAELVAYLRPLAKQILVHLPDADTSLLGCGYLGADGFILTISPRQHDSQIERTAAWLARACESQTALSCVDQIENSAALDKVKRAAVRFGMGPLFGPTLFRGDAAPIEVESFMRSVARAAQGEGRNIHRFGPKRDVTARIRPVN